MSFRLATGGQSATGKEMFKRELEGKNHSGSKIRLAANGSHRTTWLGDWCWMAGIRTNEGLRSRLTGLV